MRYMYIWKIREGYKIGFDIPGTCSIERASFIGYNKRDAIRQARICFGVVGKHFTKIEC